MSNLQAPRGTNDVYGQTMRKWEIIEDVIRQFMVVYHIEKMATPIFEHTEVFLRDNIASDVVNKEMYTFLDKGGRSITLRPEGTAGIIRAIAQHKLYTTPEGLLKYYYLGPNFRYERPQKGRMRIHHQFGVEYIGVKSPIIDAEVIALAMNLLDAIGIEDVTVNLNTLGDFESREAYKGALKVHFKDHVHELCTDCQRRYDQNPLRILDCKVDQNHPSFKTVPKLELSLNDSSKNYFKEMQAHLASLGVPFIINDTLVRGLDYYTETVFEIISNNPAMGTQSTLIAGGRYDGLLKAMGGPELSGFGFGMGMERLLLAAEIAGIPFDSEDEVDIYVLPLDDQESYAHQIVTLLRQHGYIVEMDYAKRSMKSKFKSAERFNAKLLLFIGEQEVNAHQVSLKDVASQLQRAVALDELVAVVDSLLMKEHEHD